MATHSSFLAWEISWTRELAFVGEGVCYSPRSSRDYLATKPLPQIIIRMSEIPHSSESLITQAIFTL